jgi:hypothetical protein
LERLTLPSPKERVLKRTYENQKVLSFGEDLGEASTKQGEALAI